MSAQEQAPARTILPIQWLRGVAALMVVWFHATGQFEGLAARVPGRFGEIGVDVFFVISGFIMAAVAGRDRTPLAFCRDRLVRVVPLYWAVTLAMVALAVLPPRVFVNLQPTLATTVQSLLFVPHFSDTRPGHVWPLLVPGWTLNYEMFFYALFALSLVFRARAGAALVLACSALVLAGRVFGPFEGAVAQTYTDPLLLEFVAGVLLGEAHLRGFAVRPPPAVAALLAAGAAGVLLGGDVTLLPPRSVQAAGAVLLVVGCVNLRPARDLRWLRALGDASYATYLTHVLVLALVRKLWLAVAPAPSTAASAWVFVGLGLVASAAVGALVHARVERPLTAFVRRWATRGAAAAVRA